MDCKRRINEEGKTEIFDLKKLIVIKGISGETLEIEDLGTCLSLAIKRKGVTTCFHSDHNIIPTTLTQTKILDEK